MVWRRSGEPVGPRTASAAIRTRRAHGSQPDRPTGQSTDGPARTRNLLWHEPGLWDCHSGPGRRQGALSPMWTLRAPSFLTWCGPAPDARSPAHGRYDQEVRVVTVDIRLDTEGCAPPCHRWTGRGPLAPSGAQTRLRRAREPAAARSAAVTPAEEIRHEACRRGRHRRCCSGGPGCWLFQQFGIQFHIQFHVDVQLRVGIRIVRVPIVRSCVFDECIAHGHGYRRHAEGGQFG